MTVSVGVATAPTIEGIPEASRRTKICMSKPNIPPPPPPPQAAQEAKTVDSVAQRRASRKVGMGGGTLLTSPSGVTTQGANLGGTTLLGG